jgi:aminoglycoside phosphotransferase (APT) family kinase protein
LLGTKVPVPEILGYCGDASVTGAEFYLMRYVEGWVARDRDQVKKYLPLHGRRSLGLALMDTLADLHSVDPDEVGLGDLGRKHGYVERQIRRWMSQWESWKTRDVAVIDRLHAWLNERIPEQISTVIVHGDFRLDNTIVGYEDGRIKAVLDWELCTLGDPLADLGMTLAYWVDPG